MKKLVFLLLTAFFAVNLMAQDQAKTQIKKDFQIENQTAHELYLRAFSWVNDFFNNPGNELSKLEFKAQSFSFQAKNTVPNRAVQLESVMKWSFEDGKATLVIEHQSGNEKAVEDYFTQITSRLNAALSTSIPANEKQELENQISGNK